MSDELKSAANRFAEQKYLRWGNGDSAVEPEQLPIEDLYWDDAVMLARAYLADLAAREAEERERALGTDVSWMQSIGFARAATGVRTGHWIISSHEYEIYCALDGITVHNKSMNQSCVVGSVISMTRGDLLDLLAGLKIPTKGGGK